MALLPLLAKLPSPPPHRFGMYLGAHKLRGRGILGQGQVLDDRRPALTSPLLTARLPAGPGEKNSQFAGGFNACQYGRLSPYFETYFAALPSSQFSMDMCGRCAAVRGTGGRTSGRTVVVMIVDECATCDSGDLDFTSRVRPPLGCIWGWL